MKLKEEEKENEKEIRRLQGHLHPLNDTGRLHNPQHLSSPAPHRPSPCRSDRGRVAGARWVLSLHRLWVCCLWVLIATPANTCADFNGCDFFGSGLKQDGRGIQPVYLSCSSGRVEWQYPRAGLRVILSSPTKGKDFRACIKGAEKFEGARVYLEGHRSLLPLFAADDGRPRDLVRCFTSYKGEAALYVEAEQGADGLKKQVAGFEYDLRAIKEGAIYDPMEECRPCSEEELLHLYCSGDFVARGSILAVTDKPHLDLTSLTVRASKIFQQTYPVFGHGHAHPHRTSTERGTQKNAEDEEEENDISFSSLVEEGSYVGKVIMPMQCGARWGDGEFLVMGVMRLGQPLMRCAPRYEEWLALTRRAQSQAQCILES
ncbi:hypothetical protein O3P69_004771 [Scylla paramamosain]|uniref:Meteorin-like protein n=1 Tax=Scylla paramamosain TaxID=85552 RepID=A0AAW0UB17_SCYPA